MNKWNRLLNSLDLMFGFTDKKKSTFRKVGQTFDERTNEYVIQIEPSNANTTNSFPIFFIIYIIIFYNYRLL